MKFSLKNFIIFEADFFYVEVLLILERWGPATLHVALIKLV